MIGKNIYEIRRKKGLTLSELAERASISKSYLSNIERSININPSIQVLNKIADELDVDLKAILNGTRIDTHESLEKEWIEFINELKESGIDKERISEFKNLIEFIKWQNDR